MEHVFHERHHIERREGFYYNIPSDWKWTLLGDISDIAMGKSPEGCYTTTDSAYTGLIGGASDMGEETPHITRFTKKPLSLCQKDDIIIAVRATIGKINISDGEYCIGRGVAKIHSEKLNSRFLMYYLKYAGEYFKTVATGSLFQQVSIQALRNMPIPVPPQKEQEYIVIKVEDSFARLCKAKKLVEDAKKEYEELHSYYLLKAFSGELTKEWRQKNGIEKLNWEKKSFSDVAEFNSAIKKGFIGEQKDIPYITASNIERKTGRLLACGKVQEKQERGARCPFAKNEILYVTNNPEFSRVTIAGFDGLCSTGILPIKARENEKYLWYYMLSDYFLKQLLTVNPSLKRVNKNQLKRMEIVIPDEAEQEEIVRLLDSVLEKEKKIFERIQVADEVEKIKKAILGKAFHGELGRDN